MSKGKRKRERKRRYNDNMRTPGIAAGSFIGARHHHERGHTTIWVEGDSSDGPSVSAIGLDSAGLDNLIRRLTNIRSEAQRVATKEILG